MKIFFVLLFVIVASCISRQKFTEKELSINDTTKANGDIKINGKDTIFDGQINFFDKRSGKLVEQAYYRKGIIEGKRIVFYDNGKVFDSSNYQDGKLNGISAIFDRHGQLIHKDFFYYNIPAGPKVDYDRDTVKRYSFYSLDGDELIHINYDSIAAKPLTATGMAFFLYHQKSFSQLQADRSGISSVGTEYFLYTPDPPKLNFRYSLILVDDHNTEKVIKTFDNISLFSTFSLEAAPSKGEKYAIKLIAFDPKMKLDLVMLKNIDFP